MRTLIAVLIALQWQCANLLDTKHPKSIKLITPLKARSHGAMCNYDLLYQEMECCLQFSDFVHTVRWVWMWFAMYLHWNCKSQSHRMGMEPNRVRRCTHQCITRTWNRIVWTVSLTTTQSIFCIAVAKKKKRTMWTGLDSLKDFYRAWLALICHKKPKWRENILMDKNICWDIFKRQ